MRINHYVKVIGMIVLMASCSKVSAQESPVDSLFKYYAAYKVKEASFWAEKIDLSTFATSSNDLMTMSVMGVTYHYNGNKQKAQALFDRIFENYESGALVKDSTYIRVQSVYAITKLKDQVELTAILDEQRTLIPKYYDADDVQSGLFHLLLTYYHIDAEQFDSARYHAEKVMNTAAVNNDITPEAEIDMVIAALLNTMEAETSILDSIPDNGRMSQEWKDARELSKNNINAIQLYDRLKFAESEKLLLKQMQQIEAMLGTKDHLYYMVAALNLSNIYLKTSRDSEAKALIDQAVRFFSSSPEYLSELLSAKNSLAGYYQAKGDLDASAQLNGEVLQARIKNGVPTSHIAISRLNYALSLISKFRDSGEGDSLLILADSLLVAASDEVIGIYNEDHSNNLIALAHRVSVFMLQKDWDKALDLNTELLKRKLRKLGPNHNLYASSLIKKAGILEAQGALNEATEAYRQGMGIYLDYLLDYLPYTSGSSKRGFWKDFDGKLKAYLWFLIENSSGIGGIETEMGEAITNTKSILFDFHSTRLFLENISNESKFNQWIEYRTQLAVYYSMRESETEESENLWKLVNKVDSLERDLSIYLPEGLITARPNLLGGLQKKLQDEEAYIEIYRLGKKQDSDSVYYIASIIKGDQVKLHVFKNGFDLENKHLNQYRADIQGRRLVAPSYETFWAPLEPYLEGTSTVYLNPDGVFNLISFPSLHIRASNQFLMDKYDFKIIGSTRRFVEGSVNTEVAKKALIIGVSSARNRPDLMAVDEEVDNAAKKLELDGWEVVVKKEKEALLPSKEDVKGIGLWHFAGHAFLENKVYLDGFSDAAFLRSGIFLAPRKGVPSGKVLSYEIMNYDLRNTDLVFLSACETGLGTIDNGNGVMNLRTSFSLAGAKSIIMTLWKVDDEMSELFMSKFYQAWLSSKDKMKSFKKAQMAVRNKYDHPYYWGAFVLTDQ